MSRPDSIDELHKSELPAARLLVALGWTEMDAEALELERASRREVVLKSRFERMVRALNPWISPDNLSKVYRAISQMQATTLTEANEKLHTALTYGVPVTQDLDDGQGYKNHTVRFFDFDAVKSNEFMFCRQFPVVNARGLHCFPDIVLFVNGIPLAVIECKSPTIPSPMAEAIKQINRYQELDEAFDQQGVPFLFETVQIVAGMSGTAAQYGTVGTAQKFWGEWKKPWPDSLDAFQKTLGQVPSPQDVLIRGIFAPDNFLDLVRNFIVFEVDQGRTVKKLARYQQYIAVNKALERIRSRTGKDRGGIVWHTQGSGKSLTMVYMAMKLRRLAETQNPTIVVVTDRTDLDGQITTTFRNCGFPNPIRATRISHLRELLADAAGKTILTTVQKFGGIDGLASQAENIFVMVDEAHRTQYKSLAARMRQALPNGCFLGFTGTPIDKKHRSTWQVFGDYIDTYTIKQAVDDNATVPIFYEGRMADLHVEGRTIDEIFARVFKEYDDETRDQIKSRFATEEAIAGAPKRIEQICLDLINHYESHIAPNGFKAQLVAVNREVAVLYWETLQKLGFTDCALIMSIGHNDPKRFRDATIEKDKQKTVIDDQFKNKNHPLKMLIVCDMLLTGFDAPVEQVMYLDSPLKEHTLLQAIARVNRVADGKNYGLIVDYWGVSDDLQKALEMFNSEDIQYAMVPKDQEIARLDARHQAVIAFFSGVKDKTDMESLLRVIEAEDARAEFDMAFKKFSQSLDDVLPDPAGLRYTKSLKWMNDIRAAARSRFRDDTLDLSGCGEKVKAMIEQYISAGEIRQVVEPVSIFSAAFDEALESLKSPEAKASEMEHAMAHEISVRLEENPVFYLSLRERLEKLIEARRRHWVDAAEHLKKLKSLLDEMRGVSNIAENLGMDEDQFAVYKILNPGNDNLDDNKKSLAVEILGELQELAVIDWRNKDDIQREMRRRIKRLMRAAGHKDDIDAIANDIVSLAKARL